MRKALLIASVASMTLSLTLWFMGNQMAGIYVGIWCPTILGLDSFFDSNPKGNK